VLSVEALETRYGSVAAIKRISLDVGPGEIVGVLGPNGAGKTTTLLTVVGLLKPASGRVRFMDRDITGMAPDRVVASGIGLVPEGRRLFPKLTVQEKLLLGAFRSMARAEIARNLESSYATFPALRERRGQLSGSLSGGEQQMLR